MSQAPTLPPGLEVFRPATLLGSLILVVEDDAFVRRQLVSDLEGLGYRAIEAAGVKSAQEELQQHRVEGVILDVLLDGDEDAGLDLLTWIRRRRPRLPVAVLSAARVNSISIREAYERGASSYFVKGNVPLAHLYSDLAARLLEAGERTGVLQIGPLELDAGERLLALEGRRVSLTAQQTALLAHLVHWGSSLTAAELIAAGLFRPHAAHSTVHSAILALRRRIDELRPRLGHRLLRADEHGYRLEVNQ